MISCKEKSYDEQNASMTVSSETAELKGDGLFKIHCQSCHNSAVGKNPDQPDDLNGIVVRRSTEEIIYSIKFLHEEDLEFRSLSNKEINQLLNYVITL